MGPDALPFFIFYVAFKLIICSQLASRELALFVVQWYVWDSDVSLWLITTHQTTIVLLILYYCVLMLLQYPGAELVI